MWSIRHTRSALRRAGGQSAVMVSLLTMIVVMMIAFTTNLGKLVTEKIAMQNTADLAAYSGAATQAGVLNKIRSHNQRIWQAIVDGRRQLQPTDNFPVFGHMDATCPIPCAGPPFNSTGCPARMQNNIPEQIQRMTEQRVRMEMVQIERYKNTIGMLSYQAAQDSAQANYPGTRIQPVGNSLARAPIKQDRIDVDYRPWGQIMGCPCPGPTCWWNTLPVGSLFVDQHQVPSWYFRDDSQRGELMFAVKASGTPNSPFLGSSGGTYLGNYFGNRNELVTYAAAYPMAGKIGTIQGGQNFMTNEPMWRGPGGMFISNSLQVGGGQVDRANVLNSSRVIGASYHDYKARYVGIFDSEAQFVGGSRLTGAVPNGNRMAH